MNPATHHHIQDNTDTQ